MCQVIEEKFIFDVLKGYVFYKMVFNFFKQFEDSKWVSGKVVKCVLVQWMLLYFINVIQKVQFIVEYFIKNVVYWLDGKVKVMVVISFCVVVICYKKVFDCYIEQYSEYGFIYLLVVFFGKMIGKQVMYQDDSEFKDDVFIVDENEEFIEQSMNLDV